MSSSAPNGDTSIKLAALPIPARFDESGPMQDGLAPVRQGSKWGFIKPDGSIALEAKYETALPFESGLAEVRIDGEMAYIDSKGKIVWRARQ